MIKSSGSLLLSGEELSGVVDLLSVISKLDILLVVSGVGRVVAAVIVRRSILLLLGFSVGFGLALLTHGLLEELLVVG